MRGGSSGAIYRCWQIAADYDDHIAMSQRSVDGSKSNELKSFATMILLQKKVKKSTTMYTNMTTFLNTLTIM